MKLLILTSNRDIAQHSKNIDKNSKIKIFTMEEFLDRIIIIPNSIKLQQNQRILILRKIIKKDELLKLGFEYDFLSFIKNSKFILKFFDEINLENVDIKDIEKYDIKAEFMDHIDILNFIHNRYKKFLLKNNLFDKATIKDYKINSNLISRFKKCTISIDGYLNAFEYKIIFLLSKLIEVDIKISTSIYNKKMYDKFDLDLKPNRTYLIDLNKKQILKEKNIYLNADFNIKEVKNRLCQSFFIQSEIERYVNMGIKPDNIAVILPDESFINRLQSLDIKRNLNFAMGVPYTKNRNFKILKAIYKATIDNNRQNMDRLKLLDIYDLYKQFLTINTIDEFICFIQNNFNDDEIINKELFELINLKDNFALFSNKNEIFNFFLDMLSSKSTNDIGGGKITVTGILESRGIEYDAVIIIDFNDNIVPRSSQKDIFLNSKIKKSCNLPTKDDRYNLQRHYYHMLFCNTKYLSISYVKDDISNGSRFLQLIPKKFLDTKNSTEDFNLFNNKFIHTNKTKPKIVKNSWANSTLSASKLNLYISCKRAFYYKYIKKIKEHKISLEPEPYEVGSRYHNILFEVFKYEKFSSKDELKKLIKNRLIKADDSILLKFDLNTWFFKLDAFFDNEIKRQNLGYRPIALEKSFNITVEGIDICGDIDRIDIKDDKLYIMDYKFKKTIKIEKTIDIEKIKDYQLPIYYLATKNIFNQQINSIGFYDMANGKIIEDNLILEKIEILKEVIKNYKKDDIELAYCNNRYCSYCANL